MPHCNQRSIEEEAKNFYMQKMDDYYNNCYNTMIFNVMDMKQKHMEYKFEAVDHLRKKSIEMANTWKLEKDLNEEYVNYAQRLKKTRNSFSE